MPYCPSCGVEVETKLCPLCKYDIKQDLHNKPTNQFLEKKEITQRKLTTKEKMVIFDVSAWFMSILISSICITTDILINKGITWSIIPIIPVLNIAIITTLAINLKGFLRVLSIFFTSILMLIFFDVTIPGSNTIHISIPIAIAGSLLSLLVVILFKKSKRRGANIGAFIIFALTILLIVVEGTIQLSMGFEPAMRWSLLTTVIFVPIGLFLLYIHYSLSRRVDLKKIFHT